MDRILFRIGFNTGIQIIGKVISVGLSFITVLLMTRYLGSGGYGNFTLVFTYVSFFSVIADFGLQSTMVRELSKSSEKDEKHDSFFFTKTSLIIISSLCAVILLFFFPYSSSLKLGILIAIAAVAISGMTSYGTIIFQSRVRLDLITFIDILTKIVTVGCIVIFVYFKFNLYSIIATVLIGNSIGLLVTYLLLQDVIHFKYNIHQIKRILLISFPVGISSFLGLAYFKIDTIMLSIMKNANEVGLYSLSYKVLENLLIIWGFYMASVYPLLARYKGKNEIVKMKSLLKNSFIVAGLLSLAIIFVGLISAPFVIEIFGGKSFKDSIFSLQILLFALPFLCINNLCSDFFIVHEKNKINLVGIFLSLVFNILLNLWLIPLTGFIGASYVTVFSAAFLSIYYIIQIGIFNKKKYE